MFESYRILAFCKQWFPAFFLCILLIALAPEIVGRVSALGCSVEIDRMRLRNRRSDRQGESANRKTATTNKVRLKSDSPAGCQEEQSPYRVSHQTVVRPPTFFDCRTLSSSKFRSRS